MVLELSCFEMLPRKVRRRIYHQVFLLEYPQLRVRLTHLRACWPPALAKTCTTVRADVFDDYPSLFGLAELHHCIDLRNEDTAAEHTAEFTKAVHLLGSVIGPRTEEGIIQVEFPLHLDLRVENPPSTGEVKSPELLPFLTCSLSLHLRRHGGKLSLCGALGLDHDPLNCTRVMDNLEGTSGAVLAVQLNLWAMALQVKMGWPTHEAPKETIALLRGLAEPLPITGSLDCEKWDETAKDFLDVVMEHVQQRATEHYTRMLQWCGNAVPLRPTLSHRAYIIQDV